MERKKTGFHFLFIAFFVLFLLLPKLLPALIKVRVIVSDAQVKATPEIGGQNLARIALNTILDAEEKEGSWYKVYLENQGVQLSGYIHELLVEIYMESDQPGGATSIDTPGDIPQAQRIAEIELKIEENKSLIRQERDLVQTIETLRPLIPKVFRVTDVQRQRRIAAEIYLWIGLAYAGQGDAFSALKEFKNMFEVDYDFAMEITRNIIDPEVIQLIQNAENEYKGFNTEYSLEINTDPKEATIKIDGEEIGLSPEVYSSPLPKFVLEIELNGYEPIKEEIFLSQPTSRREFVLERSGISIQVNSEPTGASVYVDEQDTELVTNCEIPFVAFGRHKVFIIKANYAPYEDLIELSEGQDPVQIDVVLTPNRYGFRRKWGSPSSQLFTQPTGIALDSQNNFYVIDNTEISVKKFDAQGKILSAWGDSGREFRRVKSPAGIAIDSKGIVYITDLRTNSLSIFNRSGVYVTRWDRTTDGGKLFEVPLGVAVDSLDDIYVADSGNHRIVKFASNGAIKNIWGAQGQRDGEFTSPAGIAVNRNNEVYVVDRSRVQKFSSEGQFLGAFGQPGQADGQFDRPSDIFVDSMDHLYVADSGNNRIQKFDPDGNFIARWGVSGEADVQLNFPVGVVVDSRGSVYVVEKNNRRFQEFGIGFR